MNANTFFYERRKCPIINLFFTTSLKGINYFRLYIILTFVQAGVHHNVNKVKT